MELDTAVPARQRGSLAGGATGGAAFFLEMRLPSSSYASSQQFPLGSTVRKAPTRLFSSQLPCITAPTASYSTPAPQARPASKRPWCTAPLGRIRSPEPCGRPPSTSPTHVAVPTCITVCFGSGGDGSLLGAASFCAISIVRLRASRTFSFSAASSSYPLHASSPRDSSLYASVTSRNFFAASSLPFLSGCHCSASSRHARLICSSLAAAVTPRSVRAASGCIAPGVDAAG